MREGTTAAARETAKKNEEMSHEKLWYRFRQQALETDSCHEEKIYTARTQLIFKLVVEHFSQLITSNLFTYLCVVNFECAARRINVAAIEILTCTRCRVDRIKFDHCLYAILLEYHNTEHLAVRMTDCVNYLLQMKENFSLKLKFYWCRISISEGCSIEIILWDNCWVGMWWLCKMSDLLRGLERVFEDFFIKFFEFFINFL